MEMSGFKWLRVQEGGFDGGRRAVAFDLADRHAYVDGCRVQLRALQHDAHRADLALLSRFDVDANHAAKADGHEPAQFHRPGLDHPAFYSMTREVHIFANHHAVAEIEHVVIR